MIDMNILTDNDIEEMKEDWNPKHYFDPKHERYIPDPVVREIAAACAQERYDMTITEFRAYIEESEL